MAGVIYQAFRIYIHVIAHKSRLWLLIDQHFQQAFETERR